MQYDLVFEGGGAKGMAFVGACSELFARGHGCGRLLGTSAGAITATLLAAGYTADEMTAALAEKDGEKSVFAGFMGEPEPFTDDDIERSAILALLRNIDLRPLPDFIENGVDVRIARALARSGRSKHVVALIERGGWFAAGKFTDWLRGKLDSRMWRDATQRQFSALTLAQFHAVTGTDLSMVASDTSDRKILVLNHRTAPDCPVVSAVRMSMSIPLVWDEVIWDAAWGKYRGREMAGHAIVDGGILSNFPLELFLSDDSAITGVMGPKQQNPVLGLLIDETLEVKTLAARGTLVSIDVKPGELAMVQRLLRLVDTATGAHDNRVIEQYGDLIVRLPAKGYGTTEFDMTESRRASLVEAARAAVKGHLDRLAAARPRARRAGPGAGAPSSRAADAVARKLLDF